MSALGSIYPSGPSYEGLQNQWIISRVSKKFKFTEVGRKALCQEQAERAALPDLRMDYQRVLSRRLGLFNLEVRAAVANGIVRFRESA